MRLNVVLIICGFLRAIRTQWCLSSLSSSLFHVLLHFVFLFICFFFFHFLLFFTFKFLVIFVHHALFSIFSFLSHLFSAKRAAYPVALKSCTQVRFGRHPIFVGRTVRPGGTVDWTCTNSDEPHAAVAAGKSSPRSKNRFKPAAALAAANDRCRPATTSGHDRFRPDWV